MKKFLMTLAVACFALTASAQEKGEFRFGVTAGMNVANVTDCERDSRIGFHVGVKGEYNITENLYGSAALLFTQKGSKSEWSEEGYNVESTWNPGYIELPIHIGYRYKFGEKVSIFGETGPYFAYGICGKDKLEGTGVADYDVKFFDYDNVNKFEFGWGVKAGVEYAKFQIGLGYEYGITKVFDISGVKPHNSNFMVSVAYMF